MEWNCFLNKPYLPGPSVPGRVCNAGAFMARGEINLVARDVVSDPRLTTMFSVILW